MASLIDSIKNVAGDSHPYFKVSVASLVAFFFVEFYKATYLPQFLKILLMFILFTFFMGFIAQTVNNTLNEKSVLMPNFINLFKILWDGAKATLALLPVSVVIYFAITAIIGALTYEPLINNIIIGIIAIFSTAFFALTLVSFGKNLNIFDAYKIIRMLKHAGDFIAYSFLLTLVVALFIAIVFFPIGIAVNILFGIGLVFEFYIIFVITFVLMCVVQYYSQMYFEFVDLA